MTLETIIIQSRIYDPDEPPQLRFTKNLTREWSCINLNTQNKCTDIAGKDLILKENSVS